MPVCRISSEPLEGARRGAWQKAFFGKSSLPLAGTRHNVGGTCSNCTFLPRAEKEQDNYAEGIIIFKRVAPERANLRFAPSGLPHSRGMA